jgi:hypothetical protein
MLDAITVNNYYAKRVSDFEHTGTPVAENTLAGFVRVLQFWFRDIYQTNVMMPVSTHLGETRRLSS